MPDYRAALLARAGRAHLVVGAEDVAYLERARSLVAEAPALGLDVIAGSGHDPTLEQPASLATALAAAVARLDAESPSS
jgi:pimeloyl-ACP methyl ester carboxylesterase